MVRFIFAVLFVTLTFASIGCVSGATAPEEEWDKTFGGTESDWAYSIQQTSDGGYILAGYTYSYGARGDALLIKTNSNGKKEWDKTFGGNDLDMMSSVQQTSDGGYILAGDTNSYGIGKAGVWLIKLKGKPTPTVTPTPEAEKDSDVDGVPDDYDYAPNDPNVQTEDDVKTPGFGTTFAICSLLAVAFSLRQRKY